MIDMGTNTSDIEVAPQRDGSRVMTLEGNVQAFCPLVDVILPSGMNEQVPMPHINLSISGYGPESLKGSHIRTQDTRGQENLTIPQLDGPVSVPIRDRRRLPEDIRIEQEYPQEGTCLQGTSVSCRREYSRDSSDDNRSYRDQRPPERGRYPNQNGRPPASGRYLIGIEGLLEEEDILEEDCLMVEDPLNSLMVEDPLMEMEDPLDPPVDKDHQVLKDILDQ